MLENPQVPTVMSLGASLAAFGCCFQTVQVPAQVPHDNAESLVRFVAGVFDLWTWEALCFVHLGRPACFDLREQQRQMNQSQARLGSFHGAYVIWRHTRVLHCMGSFVLLWLRIFEQQLDA